MPKVRNVRPTDSRVEKLTSLFAAKNLDFACFVNYRSYTFFIPNNKLYGELSVRGVCFSFLIHLCTSDRSFDTLKNNVPCACYSWRSHTVGWNSWWSLLLVVVVTCLREKFGINLPNSLFWNFKISRVKRGRYSKFQKMYGVNKFPHYLRINMWFLVNHMWQALKENTRVRITQKIFNQYRQI